MKPTQALLCLILAGCASVPTPAPKAAAAAAAKPEPLAACLARKQVRLYGASWCHWCHVQLEMFGPDAPKVPYTDCQPEGTLEFSPACVSAGLEEGAPLPIWLFKDGSRLVGVRHPVVIALVAGCPVPQ